MSKKSKGILKELIIKRDMIIIQTFGAKWNDKGVKNVMEI